MKSQSIPVSELVATLQRGEVATVPTETVEGYAVALHSHAGICELMRMKSRDFDSGKIFTLVPEDKAAITKYVTIPATAEPLIDQYIPGELTLILPRNPGFHHFYFDEYARRGKFTGIGIRIPNHKPFLDILAATGPLLLTSANPRGGTPKSTTGHLPSTIIDFTSEKPQIVRQGNLVITLPD